jgi:hypothetical protein
MEKPLKGLQTKARACFEPLYPIEMQASPADEAQHAASKKRNTPVACNVSLLKFTPLGASLPAISAITHALNDKYDASPSVWHGLCPEWSGRSR